MSVSKKFSFDFKLNFSNRKYKMIGLEIFILFLVAVLSQIIMFYWPVEEPLRTFTNDYWLYMLLALIELLLIGLMAFVLGVWHTKWRYDISVRKT